MREVSAILLTLPDGRIVFQRRSKDAKRLPGMLSFFGGHLEKGENADEAIVRELGEETSLDIGSLTWGYVQDFKLTVSDQSEVIFHLYWAEVPNADFKVFEGAGTEVYSRDEALKLDDVADSSRHVLTNILKEK